MSNQDTLSIGWARSQADRGRRSFRRLLAVDLALRVVAGAAVIVCPAFVLGLIGMPLAAAGVGWVKAWGALLICVALFHIPAYLDPQASRVLHLIGFAGRLLVAIVYLCTGGVFYWLAAYEVVAAALLYRSLRTYGIAELMTRP